MSETETLHHKLNQETARIPWKELEKHYARGVLITVSDGLDLVDVAVQFAQDNKPVIESWLNSHQICRTSDDQALQWSDTEAELWAVVVAPWILIQMRRN